MDVFSFSLDKKEGSKEWEPKPDHRSRKYMTGMQHKKLVSDLRKASAARDRARWYGEAVEGR